MARIILRRVCDVDQMLTDHLAAVEPGMDRDQALLKHYASDDVQAIMKLYPALEQSAAVEKADESDMPAWRAIKKAALAIMTEVENAVTEVEATTMAIECTAHTRSSCNLEH